MKNCSLEDVFESLDIDDCTDEQAVYFGGIGMIALLLLLVLALLSAVCCLLTKLRRIKRYSLVAGNNTTLYSYIAEAKLTDINFTFQEDKSGLFC